VVVKIREFTSAVIAVYYAVWDFGLRVGECSAHLCVVFVWEDGVRGVFEMGGGFMAGWR
jgi:hypothetical protein